MTDHRKKFDSTDWEHLLDTRRQLGKLLGKLEVPSLRRALTFLTCVAIAAGCRWLARSHWDFGELPSRALFILVVAMLLWITEAAPAFAVGILVIALEVWMLARPGLTPMIAGREWESYVAILGHPLVWLFFGGFVLAAGTSRVRLDRWLAMRALSWFGTRPSALLAGVMCVTFGFSMFMSNTATTALMLALLTPAAQQLASDDPFRKSLLLGTAVAANIGGMGSLIGTPPNAIAAGALAEFPDQAVGFVDWLAIGVLPASLLAIAAWLLLLSTYPARQKQFLVREALATADTSRETEPVPRFKRWVVTATGIATVVLWMTSTFHQIPTAVVSLLPIVVFTTIPILGPTEIRRLPWDVLFLLAGGLALGDAVQESGLAEELVARLSLDALGTFGTALVLGYLCSALSNLMSNTAAANVLVPIGVSLATGFEAHVALPLALSASAAMCLPIATPPNALVFATGEIESRDFVRVGLLVGLLAPPICTLWVRLIL